MLDNDLALETAPEAARTFVTLPLKDESSYALNLNRALIIFIAALICLIGTIFLVSFKQTSLTEAQANLEKIAQIIAHANKGQTDTNQIVAEAQDMARLYTSAITVEKSTEALQTTDQLTHVLAIRPDLNLTFSIPETTVLNDYNVARRITLALGFILLASLLSVFLRSPNLVLLAKKFASNATHQSAHELINALPEGVAIWDADKKLVASNARYRQFYGLSPKKSAAGTRYVHIHQAARKPLEIHTLAQDGAQRVTEARFDNRQWARIQDYKLPDGGFVTTLIDISEQKAREAQLVRAHASKALYLDEMNEHHSAHQKGLERQRHLLSQLSHAVRTPLNHIVGFADMMRCQTHGAIKNKTYEGYIGDIHAAGTGLLNTVSHLLSLSELDCGQTYLAKRRIHMPELFDPMVDGLKQTAKDKGCVFDCAPIPKVDLHVDPEATKHAINTLFGLILARTHTGGHVQTAIWWASDGVLLEVHSSAMQFSQSQIDVIISPFEAEALPAQSDDDDTVLELAIVHRLVEQLGGEFHIEPDAENGSMVILSLPLATHDQESDDGDMEYAA